MLLLLETIEDERPPCAECTLVIPFGRLPVPFLPISWNDMISNFELGGVSRETMYRGEEVRHNFRKNSPHVVFRVFGAISSMTEFSSLFQFPVSREDYLLAVDVVKPR